MKFTPWDNPMGTDGFEFIEYAAPDPAAMAKVFKRMGFRAIARHRHKDVVFYRQGEITFILNAEPDSFAQRFARLHGPSVCAIAFRVRDAKSAYERAVSLGAWGYAAHAGPGELNIPAIKGVGDSLIYFVDRWRGKNGAQEGEIGNIGFYDVDFEPLAGGVKLLDTLDPYYELVDKRIPGHGEHLAELKKRRILIDGKRGELLLQIFSENQLGPIFFEFIQRKGDEGFGEGNFKALFESIELDQMRRGVLKTS